MLSLTSYTTNRALLVFLKALPKVLSSLHPHRMVATLLGMFGLYMCVGKKSFCVFGISVRLVEAWFCASYWLRGLEPLFLMVHVSQHRTRTSPDIVKPLN